MALAKVEVGGVMSSWFKRCGVSEPWADVEGESVEYVRVEVRFFDQTFILSVNIVIIDNQTLKLSINIDNWSLIDNQALRLSINSISIIGHSSLISATNHLWWIMEPLHRTVQNVWHWGRRNPLSGEHKQDIKDGVWL